MVKNVLKNSVIFYYICDNMRMWKIWRKAIPTFYSPLTFSYAMAIVHIHVCCVLCKWSSKNKKRDKYKIEDQEKYLSS